MWDATVKVFAYEEEEWNEELEAFYNEADLVHVLHLKRFALWLKTVPHLKLEMPYILTSGGTDINEDLKSPEATRLIESVVNRSCGITVFSQDGRQKLLQAYPELDDRVYVIPQSVWLPKNEDEIVPVLPGNPALLLPAGLRPVKDVFFLWDELKELHDRYPELTFTIIGAALDPTVSEEVEARSRKHSWFHYLKEVPLAQMAEIYQQADIVLNTSLSEGQSTALLEAMQVGKIVMARRNPGNESIIQPDHTGILFDSPEEFRLKLEKLLENRNIQINLVKHAQTYMNSHHSLEGEMNKFLKVYTHCLS